MIWKIKKAAPVRVLLPAHFTSATMCRFIAQVIDSQRDAESSQVDFDFSKLRYIAPEGAVVLCNLIEYLKKLNVNVLFHNHRIDTPAIRYLDDSQFFTRYLKRPVFSSSHVRGTTMPLQLIHGDQFQSFLHFSLTPWISRAVGLSQNSLSVLRASIEEICHNVRDHSQVDVGCTFAQHFPTKREIRLAISDFGVGIPAQVRTKIPMISDRNALAKACEYGFSTKSNVQNRGVGLPTLMKFVTEKNRGTVLINSGVAQASASRDEKGALSVRTRASEGFYPGTLVQVILRTDTLERLAEDVESESFEWD